MPAISAPKDQSKALAKLRARFKEGRPNVQVDRARLTPVWEALGVDTMAIAQAGATFFAHDGHFYFTTTLRAPRAMEVDEQTFNHALQQSQSTRTSR